ncbi:uncharacterized protein B0I36DRAFT_319726 [Microdochium trichocladiopsis]|uniref:Uncharacterized protein n=1 Tax=Microdochium trichocladiopsis TaxID=1682393 RepID=A0A9P8Y8Q5_9PEZI|nr:uncharacterized protein B0I36DRAFT_319726 [Microdochium trichocladiopsis]KAH7032611.1 hypothetical protein B0I36DRAFT_319726 [Microdochium trichocladiopsis]
MSMYCQLEFAFTSDRLPALTGMVERMAEVSGFTYLLGCWEETIASDLAWEGTHRLDDSQLIPGIPSWSWISRYKQMASPKDSIEFSNGANVNCTRLISSDIKWQDQPLVSELLRAHLTLCGPVKNLLIPSLEVRPLSTFGPDRMNIQDGTFEEGLYTCLLMKKVLPGKPKGPSWMREQFLTLQEVQDVGKAMSSSVPCYRRVGMAASYNRHHFDDAEDRVIELV